MKTFQKIALVSAIAAAPFAAQADLTPMDDALMGDTTGQAGVTIELSIGTAGISVGEIEYTDTAHEVTDTSGVEPGEAGYVSTLADGGSVLLQNLTIKNVTKLTQTIDVDAGGHLQLGMTGDSVLKNKVLNADGTLSDMTHTDLAGPGDNSGETLLTTPADSANMTQAEVDAENAARLNATIAGSGVAGIEIALGGAADGSDSAVLLQGTNGTQAELVNHLNINMDLGDSSTTIYNLANVAAANGEAAGTLGAIGVVGDHATSTSSLAIGMEASFRINDLDVGMFGYTQTQATTQTGALDTGITSTTGSIADASAAKANAIIDKYNAKTGGSVAAATSGTALTTDQKNAITGAISTGSAVEIENLSFMGSDGGMVEIDQTIWADSSAVYMQIGAIKGDLNIHAIKIGGASIGSVRVSDINLAGLTQKIYGH